MPIDFQFDHSPLTYKEMRDLDYLVMSQAFASHKELGRLCDEKIYQADLSERLISSGMQSVLRETPLRVSFKDFYMTYFLDLLVGQKAIYELKTCTALTSSHIAQLLNYLLLCDFKHGKLINFRPTSVESKYVNSPLKRIDRQSFEIITENWDADEHFSMLVIELIRDWGTGLELSLYRSALVHLLGGDVGVTHSLPVTRQGLLLGHQSFNLYSPHTAVSLTSLNKGLNHHAANLRKMLSMTDLDQFYWVNIGIEKIEFNTVS